MKDRSQPMWHGSDASEVKATESKLDNPDNLRRIYRTIASAVIFSRDTKLLMGRKDPKKGGVYSDIWHITGGGVEDAETVDDAVVREISQEVRGLDISRRERLLLPWVGSGGAAKTLPTREHVWAEMQFHRFEVHLSELASELEHHLRPGDDLVELRWFSRPELIPVLDESGLNSWFVEAGYVDPRSAT